MGSMKNAERTDRGVARIVTTVVVAANCPFIAWLGGYDFDYRGHGVAMGYLISAFITGAVYFFPGWDHGR